MCVRVCDFLWHVFLFGPRVVKLGTHTHKINSDVHLVRVRRASKV